MKCDKQRVKENKDERKSAQDKIPIKYTGCKGYWTLQVQFDAEDEMTCFKKVFCPLKSKQKEVVK